ncbi:hypothetical protein PTQ21_27840 [Paenibacillus marchantiae]|uniref:hypothetical protein n=1 Tax=Paenibacillus marchantiae TaxID=3026433 RepID=UPI00237B614D|nr:hypothetical protein [Paenibacillus marchantiae]WDQ32148.1 hypothetical protein PTQ21_27840 [Paenibacillus marchantiae]
MGRWEEATRGVKEVVKPAYDALVGGYKGATDILQSCSEAALARTPRLILDTVISPYISYIQILNKYRIIPSDLIDDIWNSIFRKVKQDPDPRLYRVTNPGPAARGEEAYNLVRVPKSDSLNDYPYIFIYGMENDNSEKDSLDFYKAFEKTANMFTNSHTNYDHVSIYILAYDSKLSDEKKTLVQKAIESIFGTFPGGVPFDLYTSVVWRELERRARVSGDYLSTNFLSKMSNYSQGRVFTHSLGCYVFAHAAHLLNADRPLFASGFCMAAALPSNAFAPNGEFYNAPKAIAIGDSHGTYGTTVWFSMLDSILMLAYPAATFYTALGQTGSLQSNSVLVIDLDVTACVGEAHMIKQDYFKKAGKDIRRLLRTELWSETPQCSVFIPGYGYPESLMKITSN